jgi:hypothetical protein
MLLPAWHLLLNVKYVTGVSFTGEVKLSLVEFYFLWDK